MLLRLVKHFSACECSTVDGVTSATVNYSELKDIIDRFCPKGFMFARGSFFQHEQQISPLPTSDDETVVVVTLYKQCEVDLVFKKIPQPADR